MTLQHSPSKLIARRAELLAELFFQELTPEFVSRPTAEDLGYDLLVGFRNEKNGINTFAVEIKGTDRPVSRSSLTRSSFDRLAHSNLPGMLMVADVKASRLYYAWLKPGAAERHGNAVSVPVIEIDSRTKEALKAELTATDASAAAEG
jgi:hypothetical protein